jgi:hypothetical protein
MAGSRVGRLRDITTRDDCRLEINSVAGDSLLVATVTRNEQPATSYWSLCTVVGENAGRQTATYSAPSGPGVL